MLSCLGEIQVLPKAAANRMPYADNLPPRQFKTFSPDGCNVVATLLVAPTAEL
jgi:hypothetical protein